MNPMIRPINIPRMINMHRWDETTEGWAQQADMLAIVNQLIDDTPVLQQTMLYFKPPGGRGQGLHQDQQYITTEPLIGVWIALDESDKAVGQMTVIPGSHQFGHLPVQAADTSVSFTPVQSVIPAEASEEGINMEPGDALFFDGKNASRFVPEHDHRSLAAQFHLSLHRRTRGEF